MNKKYNYILGIETSCDDTSVAVLNGDGYVLSQISANQDLVHQPFGGIVPEIASRNHTMHLLPLVDEVLKKTNLKLSNIQGIAATNRPGLLGSLLVGMVTAKTLSLSLEIPWIGVHHIEGHILAPFLKDNEYQPPKDWSFPFLSLVVSGGHTSLYVVKDWGKYQLIGKSIDDAAGEAFDKFAKMLDLGYPGGVQIDKLSQKGDRNYHQFPRAMLNEDNFDFSFSGLKASAQRYLSTLSNEDIQKNKGNICASYQEAIVSVLLEKVKKAALKYSIGKISVTGGVSANSRLRQAFQEYCTETKKTLAIPPIRFCTDNAAMIALAGLKRLENGESSQLTEGVVARASI